MQKVIIEEEKIQVESANLVDNLIPDTLKPDNDQSQPQPPAEKPKPKREFRVREEIMSLNDALRLHRLDCAKRMKIIQKEHDLK